MIQLANKNTYSFIILVMFVALMFLTSVTAIAQTTQSANVLTGMLSVIHADPQPGSGGTYRAVTVLDTPDGQTIALDLPISQAEAYIGQIVQVTGRPLPIVITTEAYAGGAYFHVDAITSQGSALGFQTAEFPISGTKSNINILCSFTNANMSSFTSTFFNALMSNNTPGLGHYFNNISYGQVTVNTTTQNIWYELSGTVGSYPQDDFADADAIAQECLSLADSAVNFGNYSGVNLMFDGNFANFALGSPTRIFNLDGTTRILRTTWNPPFSWQDHFFIGHEIGHTFNMRHTGGVVTYDNFWDIMSGGGEDYSNLTLSNGIDIGGIAPGTSAVNMQLAGWVGLSRTNNVPDRTQEVVTLDSLVDPASGSSDLIAVVPINGSTQQYYTAEVYYQRGYNINHPFGNTASGILIYRVNTNDEPIARIIDADGNGNVNDAGALFTVGESYYDATNNIRFTVQSTNGVSTFTVLVENDPVAPVPAQVTGVTVNGNLIGGQPTINWNHAGTATWYRVYITGGATPVDQWIEVGNTVTCTATCSKTISLPTGDYSVWVYGWNSAGNGPWSDPAVNFHVGPPAPLTPTGLSATGTLNVVPAQPTYSWTHDPNTTYYELYVSGPSGLILDQWFQVGVNLTCASTCSINTVGALSASGSHSMWVRAWNAVGYSAWSTAYNFQAGPPLPNTPTGLNATGSLATVPVQPTYSWTHDPNTTYYELYVSGPSGLIMDQWFQVGVNIICVSTCSIAPAVSINVVGSYSMWIRAWNPTGYSVWSNVFNFQVGPPAPTLPSGLSALQNGSSVQFSWNHNINTTWYELYVSGPSGLVFDRWYEVGVNLTCTTTCTLTPPETFAVGAYTFWVRAWNISGYSAWSAAHNFSVVP